MSDQTYDWKKHHQKYYKAADWIDKPALFAQDAISYLPKTGKILDLGAGQGQDSRYFAEHGYDVVSTDLEESALDLSKAKLPGKLKEKVTVQKLDLAKPFPFDDHSFDVVYAHLSLHYFSDAATKAIFAEINRVLRPGGVLAFFTNSVDDPEYGTGPEIEPDYFMIGGLAKRYFSVKTAGEYAKNFEVKLLDNNGETYKDAAKGIHHLIRFIGTKPQ
ncbi:MAG TPA: methyltransferase domain-containing protein [Candidatus Pristimantibacillus sp.]|jgi:SAM-dependent methyltransferase|nr:methyltransferase domain-containing protein [Candidatus Pristimantibacillus sp.]